MYVGIVEHEPSVTRASLLATLTSNLSVDVIGSCKIGIIDEFVEDSFFAPHGTTSLATHATLTYYWFFG